MKVHVRALNVPTDGFRRLLCLASTGLNTPAMAKTTDDGPTGCAVKALVHSGGIPARELVRSTR
jgi:hypothetical protein